MTGHVVCNGCLHGRHEAHQKFAPFGWLGNQRPCECPRCLKHNHSLNTGCDPECPSYIEAPPCPARTPYNGECSEDNDGEVPCWTHRPMTTPLRTSGVKA